MEIEQFWKLMERTHEESGGSPPRQFDLLVQTLVGMPESDIIDYDRIYETLENRAYTSDVWNAAYIMTSCGDDSFTDFRGWLIAQGKTVYENALRDPDTLADVVLVENRDQYCWQSLSYVAYDAYNQKTGTDKGVLGSGFHPVLTGNIPLLDPSEECQQHYPNLWAKFSYLWRELDDQEANEP